MMMVAWFTDWRDFKILPYGTGGLFSEPAYVYEVVQHASTVINEIDAERAKTQRKELERKMKKGRGRG